MATLPDTTPRDDPREQAARLTPLIGRLRRAVNRRVRAQVGGAPLPEAQLDVLRTVAQAEAPPRIQDVAAALRLAPNTVSTLVGALVARDLLSRRADAQDARVARLSLTPAARRRMQHWRAHRAELVGAQLALLSDAERRAVERALPALERLADILESDA